jgi:hypothetical protein
MLEHFGVARVEELPQYVETAAKINQLLTQGVSEEQTNA